MVTYLVDAEACTACGACLLTCPSSAFVVAVPLTVDPVRCTDCGACVEVCPADAVVRTPATASVTTLRSGAACRPQGAEDQRETRGQRGKQRRGVRA